MLLNKQLHVTRSKYLNESVNPVINSELTDITKKPDYNTGIWTAPWRPETQDSVWVELCRDNVYPSQEHCDPYDKNWFIVTPVEANVFVVDSIEDFNRLISKYGYIKDHYTTEEKIKRAWLGHDDLTSTVGIDFSKMSQDYDGLWLTAKGFDETRTELSEWESDVMVWFRWCFSQVEGVHPPILKKLHGKFRQAVELSIRVWEKSKEVVNVVKTILYIQ